MPSTGKTEFLELSRFEGGDQPSWKVDYGADMAKIDAGVKAAAPPGSMTMYAGVAAPEGWLLCDGQAVGRSTYARLFASIGTIHGEGDGATTFNVPDMRSRFPLGAVDEPGETGGEASHTLTAGELAPHQHTEITWSGMNVTLAGGSEGALLIQTSSGGARGNLVTNNAGGGQPHNNMPPYLTMNYIIKT